MLKRILSVWMVLMLSIIAGAQETTSEIQGRVTSGNTPVAGATITALHVPTGTKYATASRNDGRYNLPNLRVGGPYTITTTSVGYGDEKQENITLILGQEFKADFNLTASAASLGGVVVRATNRQDKVFNNNRTGSQEVISRTQLDRLPTINRSLQDFTKLTPSSNGLSFGGRSSAYNNVTIDGAQFNNAFGLSGTLGGQTNSQPISLDALEQIQVSIAPFDVRQGSFTGAGINSVTKSGTNQFRGTVYTYEKGPGLVGRRVKQIDLVKQQFDYSQYGASFGGPIIKNKLFFFVSGERERIEEPATSFVASRNGSTGANVSNVRAEDLDRLRAFLIDKFQYDPGAYEGYSLKTSSDKLTAKLDWNINSKNVFTVKYNYLKSFREVPASNSGAPAGGRGAGVDGLPFKSSFYEINNDFNILIAELNTRFSNKFSNKLQIGYTQLRDYRASLGGKDFPLVDIENAGSRFITSFGYEQFTYNNKLSSDIFQISDIATFYAGKHELVVGTQNYFKKFENGFAPAYNGVYRFRTLDSFYNSVNNGAANAVRYDFRYSAQKGGAFPFAEVGIKELGFFVQDKWRLKKNLTVTAGLRADAPIYDNSFQFNENVPKLIFRDGLRYNTGQAPKTTVQFSPRLGVNWDVKSDQKTQIRGGVGIFAGPPPFVWVSNQASNNGVQFGSYVLLPGQNGILANDPRFVFRADVNANRTDGGAASTSYNLVFTEENFKYPQVLRADVAIDQKLPGGIVGTLEFTYNKDLNAVYFQNVALPRYGLPLYGADNRIRYNATTLFGSIPLASGGNTATSPNISDAILMRNSKKGYSYVGTIQLQKTARNFYGSVAYTYSKARTLNDGGSIAQTNWSQRPVKGDPNVEDLGYANFYQPHRIIAQGSYRIEYAKFFATSIGLIFDASPNGTGSYTYNGDVNRDGVTFNDLLYIPRNQSEILLVPSGYGTNPNYNPATNADRRTAEQIWQQFNNYINQDWYLSRHRGQVAERNAALAPFFKRLDLNITEDIFVKTGKSRHTLRLSLDIVNVGNLINRRWGIQQVFTRTQPLVFEKVETAGPNIGRPTYSFSYLDGFQTPLVNSYRDNTGIGSRWQGQVGVRYIFN